MPYLNANESLEAITQGLQLEPKDRILTICGSADQALAMLEHTHNVLAVDTQTSQIEFAKQRVNLIREGRFEEFLIPNIEKGMLTKWDKKKVAEYKHNLAGFHRRAYLYFKQPGRLQKIQERIESLEIKERDIFNIKPEEGLFTKIYLSNVLTYGRTHIPNFTRIRNLISRGGLLYISLTFALFNDIRYNCIARQLEKYFEKDEQLSRIARDYEKSSRSFWDPSIFRRR